MRTRWLFLLILAVVATPAAANDVTYAATGWSVHHDTSPPLREMAAAARSQEQAPQTGEDREIPLLKVEDLPPRLEDPHPYPLRQTSSVRGVSAPPPILSFDGLGQVSGVTPPDTEGDVGLDHIVQWNNLKIAVWDKDDPLGGPIFGPVDGNTLFAGFGGPCEATNNGDPIVIYDHLADRWFLSQFAVFDGMECIAISTTSDPTGPYHRYAFVPVAGQQNDYPHCGLWTDGYYCTYRMFPSGTPPFATFHAMERDAMLQGDPAQEVVFGIGCLANNCPDGVQPIHLQGPPPPAGMPMLFVKDWDDDFNATGAAPDRTRMWEMAVDWDNTAASTFTEVGGVNALADFDQDMCGFFVRACVQQPPPAVSTNFLDPIDELTMWRAQYRYWGDYETIVMTHTIDATGGDVAASRWVEMRRDLVADGAPWTTFQEGAYQPDTDDRWMGSIAMDASGNIAVGYSVSSLATMPAVRYTARHANDPLNTMRDEQVLVAGTGVNQSSTNRWGDYSTMTVDPEDDCTFWFFEEYMAVTGVSTYSTRIGSFKFDDCTSATIFTDGFESGDTSRWDTVAN